MAGQVDGVVGGGGDGFVGVEAVPGSPPADGPSGGGLGRLDVSGVVVGGSGHEGERGPVAAVFGGGFLEAPVAVVPVVGPAPEGFGGLAMCAGGFVCGSASQFLPGPTGLSCSVTASVIVFSWDAVSGADGYTAKLQLASGQGGQTVRTTSATSVVFGGLSSSTAYYIGVHSNVGGVAQYYSGVYCTTAVGRPWCGAVSGSGVQLVWGADSRVHQWYLARATSGGSYVDGRALAGSTLSAVFTGLEANVSYTFFFWWRASAGGAWTQVHPSAVCTTAAPPAAPVVSCTTTASSIAVGWEPVGGALRYRVSRGSGWASPAGRSHVFSNLEASTAYSVRVQGWNSAGWGQTGSKTCTTLAATLPAPTGLGCEATSSQIRFFWDEVSGADSYSAKIQLAVAGSAQTEIPTGSTTVTFAGLAASTKYWASVLAVKDDKAQHFAGVNCTTLADIAAPVLSCKATSGTVTVSWDAVDGATRYRARAGTGAWTGDIAAPTAADTVAYTFTGLAPGAMHTITVQSGRTGEWGNAASVRCVTAAPGVYCDDTTSNSIVVSWDPVDGAKKWYAALYDGTTHTKARTITDGGSTEFTGLQKAARYVISLWWQGTDEKWSKITPSPECWTKHLDTPVLADEYTTGGNTITIAWEPVEGAQRYQAQISPAGTAGAAGASVDDEWKTVISTGTFHTFTDLTAGVEYTVRLRALDAQGNHSAAAEADSEASKVECEAVTSSGVTLSWEDPEGEYEWRLARITGINQYADSRTLAKGAGTQTAFTGLSPDMPHWFFVERRTESTGPWEAYTPFPHCHTSPLSPVLAPCPQAADVDGTIRWAPNGADYYRITLDHTQNKPEWIITNSTAHTFTNLEEGKTYEVAVQARNPQGWSKNSTCEDNKDKKKMKTLPAIEDKLVTGTGDYYFTEGTIKGVLYAAESAINTYPTAPGNTWNSCKSTIDKTKLAAIMLSILPGEATASISQNSATSPMVLSRSDNLNRYKRIDDGVSKSLNYRTYSHMQVASHERAHWSPGVGPWQIDFFGAAVNLNHAERADITKGGVGVAGFLLLSHCHSPTNDQGLREVLNGRWYGCSPEREEVNEDGNTVTVEIPDVCYDRYIKDPNRIYKSGNLNIRVVTKDSQGVALNQVDGGIHERLCRWTSDEIPISCYLYDTGNVQGAVIDQEPLGTRSGFGWTPYPAPFISFSDPQTHTKYALWPKHWPASTGRTTWPTDKVSTDISIYRATKQNEYVRCSPGRDPTPEPKGHKDYDEYRYDCAEGTYKPFGDNIRNIDFSNGLMIVEGWFDESVPYKAGTGESVRHRIEVENCGTIPGSDALAIYCWWDDI